MSWTYTTECAFYTDLGKAMAEDISRNEEGSSDIDGKEEE